MKKNIVTSFKIVCFATFFIEETDGHAVITCILTVPNHVLSSMQDRLLQLIQLMLYQEKRNVGLVITNKFIGYNITLNNKSIEGYKSIYWFQHTRVVTIIARLILHFPGSTPSSSYSNWSKYGYHTFLSEEPRNDVINLESQSTYY